MKNILRLAVVNTLISIGVQLYATSNYYNLKLSMGHKSTCNINDIFNCDVISASVYSKFLNIPISLWAASTLSVMLILLLVSLFHFTDDRDRALRWSFAIASFAAFMSILMGTISIFLVGAFCLSCIASYVLSFIGFELVRRSQEDKNYIKKILSDLRSLGQNIVFLAIIFATIPALSYFTHYGALNSFEAGNLDQIVSRAIYEWKSNEKHEFNVEPTLSYGPKNAKLVVSEFADFLCGHCKLASPNINNFKKSNLNVRVDFYTFPLDGACNPVIPSKADGKTCLLAKATYCSGKMDSKLGWQMHDQIFEAQQEIYSTSYNEVESKIKSWGKFDDSQWAILKDCIESEPTQEAIAAQAKFAEKIGVRGTPTIFANGKKLPRGQSIPVLEAALANAKAAN